MSRTTWLEPKFDIILAWFKECNHVTSLSSATNLKLIDFLLLIAGAIYEMGNNGLEWSYKMEYKHNLWLWRSQFDITRVVYSDGEQTEEIKKALVLVGANQEAIIRTAPILDNWFYANWGPAPCMSPFPDILSRKYDYDGGLQEKTTW